MSLLIWAALENLHLDTQEPVKLGGDEQIDILDWKEGVEDLASKTEKELWMLLRLPDKQLPFFQEWMDPSSIINPWSNKGQAWLNDLDKGCLRSLPWINRPRRMLGSGQAGC